MLSWSLWVALSIGTLQGLCTQVQSALYYNDPANHKIPTCNDITQDQMTSTLEYDTSVYTELAAALCAVVYKSYGWIILNVYPPAGDPTAEGVSQVAIAAPDTLAPISTDAVCPITTNKDGDVVSAISGDVWWPYAYKLAYESHWISSSLVQSCGNPLEAITGYESTTQYTGDGSTELSQDDLWTLLSQHSDSTPMILAFKGNNDLLSWSSCVAVMSTNTNSNGDRMYGPIVVWENFNGVKSYSIDTMYQWISSVSYLTEFESFTGEPVGDKTFSPHPSSTTSITHARRQEPTGLLSRTRRPRSPKITPFARD